MIPVAIRLRTRNPRGPVYYPVPPDYAYEFINDGHVVARTRYRGTRRDALASARALAKRKRFNIVNLGGIAP